MINLDGEIFNFKNHLTQFNILALIWTKTFISLILISLLYIGLQRKSKTRNISYFLVVISKITIFVSHLYIPKIFRKFLFGLAANVLKINKDDMEDQNYEHYRTAGELFIRKIKVNFMILQLDVASSH